nr:MAG TPA: terminase small subunit [Caudoviricetes sp.]
MRAALYGPQAVFPSGLKSRGGMVRVAKAAYEEWLEADRLALLQGWARDGLTDEQIVHNMGIAASTLYQWKKRHPEIAEALKKGKEVVDYEVENALLQKALGGDTTAMIFWLKNRRPDRWRDRPEAAEKGEGVRILDNY